MSGFERSPAALFRLLLVPDAPRGKSRATPATSDSPISPPAPYRLFRCIALQIGDDETLLVMEMQHAPEITVFCLGAHVRRADCRRLYSASNCRKPRTQLHCWAMFRPVDGHRPLLPTRSAPGNRGSVDTRARGLGFCVGSCGNGSRPRMTRLGVFTRTNYANSTNLTEQTFGGEVRRQRCYRLAIRPRT
jgi:hypothetical protein